MKYALFLGCNMPTIRPDAERAIRLTMEKLGVELIDAEGYSCCPGYGTFPASDEAASLAVSGRNLAIAEKEGVDFLVQCGSCYSVMRHAGHAITHDKEKRAKANELLKIDGKEVKGTSTTRHMIDVLYNEIGTERISESIIHRLDGMEMVVQYPCHTLWPSDVMVPPVLTQFSAPFAATIEFFMVLVAPDSVTTPLARFSTTVVLSSIREPSMAFAIPVFWFPLTVLLTSRSTPSVK